MSTLEIVLRLLAGVALTLANAFFVTTEFALTRLPHLGEEEMGDDPRLKRAWEMTERLEIYLTGCQLGITASSILLGVVAEPAVSHLIRPAFEWFGAGERTVSVSAVVLAVILINLVHKIWGEQAPTYLGVERPKEVARWAAPVHYYWTKAMYPVIYLGDGAAKATLRLFGVEIRRSWTEEEVGEEEAVSYGELRRRLDEILSLGPLSRERRREVVNALEIQEIPVSEVMVPREEIVALRTGRPVEENLELLARHGLARWPLVGEELEDFRGIVYVPSLFARLEELRRGECSFEDLAAEPFTLDAEAPVSEAIDRFQEAGQELALVVEPGDESEEGGEPRVVGLLTATDALEAIIGELEDPMDRDADR